MGLIFMRAMITDLSQWPRSKAMVPIFTCSEEAIFYAHLIFKDEAERLKLVHLRRKVLFDLKVMRAKPIHNFQRMMDLAVKGQFYRECLEEVERIEKEGP